MKYSRAIAIDDFLVAVAVLAQAVVILAATYIPYCDTTNHLSRYVLMERYWFGNAPDYVEVTLRPSNFLGLDLIGVALVHLFNAGVAAKVIALMAGLSPGIGLYLLLRSVSPERRGWALVGVMLGFNYYYFWGYSNYVIGVGLVMAWLALFFRHKAQPSRLSLVGLVVSALLLAVVHLSSVLLVAIIVGAYCLHSAWPFWREPGKTALRSSILTIVTTLGPALLLFLVMSLMGGSSGRGATKFRPPLAKVRALLMPFITLSTITAATLGGGYVASLSAFVWGNRRALKCDGAVLASLFLLGFFAIFPVAAKGTYDLDVRFLLPAFLLPFAVASSEEQASRTSWLFVPFVLCLINDAAVYRETRTIDRSLTEYAQVLDRIPSGKNVLPLVCDKSRRGVSIYRHFAQWRTIKNQGRVASLFSAPGTPYYEHFKLSGKPLYYPGVHWGLTEFPPLNPEALAQDYDYIVQIGENKQASTLIEPHASLAFTSGIFKVYHINDHK